MSYLAMKSALVLAIFWGQFDSRANTERRLDPLLEGWDQIRRDSQESRQKFTWTYVTSRDSSAKGQPTRTVYRGEIFIKSPDHLRLETRDIRGNPLLTLLCVGETAKLYLFTERVAYIVSLPQGFRLPSSVEHGRMKNPGFSQAILERSLWHLLGPPVKGLNRLFFIRVEEEDGHRDAIRLTPAPVEGWSFDMDTEWQLAFEKNERWVRRIWYGTSSPKREIVVDFEKPKTSLPSDIWNAPFNQLPKGWVSRNYPVIAQKVAN
jgi:hypothetical protein